MVSELNPLNVPIESESADGRLVCDGRHQYRIMSRIYCHVSVSRSDTAMIARKILSAS